MKRATTALLTIAMLSFACVQLAQAEKLSPTVDKALLNLLVVNSRGKPVIGTTVSVRDAGGRRLFAKVTDKKGILQLLVDRGKIYKVKFISLANPEKETLKKIQIPDRPNFKFTLKLIYNPTLVTTFVLSGVYFDTGKSVLKPESYPNLADLLEYLQAKAETRIELSGHTDSEGDDDMNMKLSDDRAKSVKEYLVKKGIAADRIEARGYGETRPISSNKTAAGRKQNRRTEVKILKK